MGTEFYDELQTALFSFAESKGEYQSRYEALEGLYKGLDETALRKELAADLVGDYIFTDEKFVRSLSSEHKNIFQKIYDEIKYLVRSATAGSAEARELEKIKKIFDKVYSESGTVQKNTADGGVRYSISPTFISEYDAWNKVSKGGYFKIGSTSNALESVGIKPSSIYWDKSKIIKIKKDHPEMTDDVIKQVPNLLEEPVIIMQSATVANRVVVLGEVYAEGSPVLCALELKPNGQIDNFIKVASAYPKNSVQNLVDTSDILYLDPNKKRTDSWLSALRLQLPAGVTNYGSIGIVTYTDRNVKGEIVFPENTDGKSAIQAAFEKAGYADQSGQEQYTQKKRKNSLSPREISIAPPVDGYNVRGEDVMIAPKVEEDAEIDIAPPVEAEPEISIAPKVESESEGDVWKEISDSIRADTLKAETVETVEEAKAEPDIKKAEEAPRMTVKEKLESKLQNSKNELERVTRLRESKRASYDEKISAAQSEYASIKNKDSKAANTLANANAEAAINESAAKIEKELTGLGVKGDVKKVAQALAKDAAGVELSVYDRYLLKHNGVAQAYTYLHSVDDSVTSFVSSVLSMTDRKSVSKRKKRIGEISGSHAELISQIIKKELGVDMDLHGYELWIDGSGIEHIEYRHGKNGKADQSMKNITDYGRIPWVVENADSGSLLRKDNGEVDYDVTHKNSDGSPSPQIKLSKQIGNTEFFVVECVPDSNAKRLYIKSAYKRKSSNGQELNLEQNSSQQPTSEMLLDGITTNTIVSQKSTDVNSKNSLSPEGISIAPPVDGYNVRGEDVMIAPKVEEDAEIDIAPPVEAEPEISIAPSESKSVEADEFTEKTLNSFGVERIGDYIHVQRQVFDTLLNEGFFTNTGTRSRTDVNEETGMVIETNKSSIRETFNLSNYERLGKNKKVAKLATVRMIPEAIQKGKLISDNVPNQYENSTNKTFAYISYDTEINGIPVTIKLDVKKTPHKNKLWVHSVFTEKNSTGLDVSFQKGRGGTPYRTDAIGEIIPQENDVVNRDDATSIAPPVEKDAEISIAPPVDEGGKQRKWAGTATKSDAVDGKKKRFISQHAERFLDKGLILKICQKRQRTESLRQIERVKIILILLL